MTPVRAGKRAADVQPLHDADARFLLPRLFAESANDSECESHRLWSLKQRLEKLKSLTLVFLLGVFIRVSAQVNALAQLVHRLEMFFPQTVEHLQHDLLLDLSHRVANRGAFFIISTLNCVDNAFA